MEVYTDIEWDENIIVEWNGGIILIGQQYADLEWQ